MSPAFVSVTGPHPHVGAIHNGRYAIFVKFVLLSPFSNNMSQFPENPCVQTASQFVMDFPERFKMLCLASDVLYVEFALETGPSPGFSSRGAKNQKEGPKTRRGVTFLKYSIGCMQHPGGQTWMGGTDFKWGGRAPLAPPLATALAWDTNLWNRSSKLYVDSIGTISKSAHSAKRTILAL